MALAYYRALVMQDEGDGPGDGFGVVFPDLPGCASSGMSHGEAAVSAAEALTLHLQGMVAEGAALPSPSDVGAPPPDWLEGAGRVVAEVLVPAELPGRTVRANITLDEGLLRQIDRTAQRLGSTRSGFLADAARDRLLRHQREWADKRGKDLRQQLELLKSGRMHSYENRGSVQVETTRRDIERIEGWLAELTSD